VACTTATAAAIHRLRQDFADLPIVGIEPALKPAAAQSQTKHIGVLATRGTLNSEKFGTLLASLQGQAHFVLQACDGLADAIERDDAIKTEALCAQFARAIGPFGLQAPAVDTLVLGCTHYPFATDALRASVGQQVAFLEGGAPVARQTRRLLEARGWLGLHDATSPEPVFGTPGAPAKLQSAIARWLQLATDVAALSIA